MTWMWDHMDGKKKARMGGGSKLGRGLWMTNKWMKHG